MQPSGGVAIVGTALTGVFARDGLAKLGIEAQFGQRHEFKSAPDTFLRSSMSAPQRDSYQRLADSLVEELATTVARRRGITPAEVRDAIDAAPLTPQQALERKLIDQIGYRDEAYLAMRRRIAGTGHERRRRPSCPSSSCALCTAGHGRRATCCVSAWSASLRGAARLSWAAASQEPWP